tara:strand:- start:17 stop:211 length:195 start_codon:yes stop_codon:yes gene_type:complete
MSMEIKLNDDEIREVLAEAMAKRISYVGIVINPQSCWFEAEAGMIEGADISDIHEVKFCYRTEE